MFGISHLHGTTRHDAIAELADRPPLRFGATEVRPATREVVGPGGTMTVEPRVMRVLLALADAAGGVVTREALAQRCWQGVFVGEDSINRAIAEVRRIGRAAAAGDIGVETIPKTGYRLTGAPAEPVGVLPSGEPTQASSVPAVSRRAMLGGAVVATAGLAGFMAWQFRPQPEARRSAALLERGALALREGLPEADQQGIGFLREAVALAPGDATAWGKLALALRHASEYAAPGEVAAATRDCQVAAQRALALDPDQPDARIALVTLPPYYGDWTAAEARFRVVLDRHPGAPEIVTEMAMLLMSTGRVTEATRLHGIAARLQPLSPVLQYRAAYGLWATGRVSEADRTIDRAMLLWPRHPGVWLARLWTLAFTGRPARALTMLANDDVSGLTMPPPMQAALRTSLIALDTQSLGAVTAATAANLQAATRNQSAAINALLLLGALGAVDAAMDVARGYLLRQGPVAVELERLRGEPSVNDQRRRKTMMLWMPATATLRADPRFLSLCRDIGLVEYWRASGTRPDYLRGRSV